MGALQFTGVLKRELIKVSINIPLFSKYSESDKKMDLFAPIPEEPFDLTVLSTAIKDALLSKSTQVFLDTSVLVHLFRLHHAARTEVIDWLLSGPQAGSVRIPSQAIHEFSRHRGDPNTLLPFKQQLKTIPKLLEQASNWAHLLSDDARVKAYGYSSRKDYLTGLADCFKDAEKFLKPVIGQDSLEEIERVLVPVFNKLALTGEVYDDFHEMRCEYDARAEVRIPPGFRDSKKKSSSEDNPENSEQGGRDGANRYGDYVIWEEILRYLVDEKIEADAVIFVSQDQKDDWCNIPRRIIDLDGNTKHNHRGPLRVTHAHPLLSRELKQRTGIPQLFMLSLSQLAWFDAQMGVGLGLNELATAVQAAPKGVSKNSEGEADNAESEVAEEEGTPDQMTKKDGANQNVEGAKAFLNELPDDARKDRLYQSDRRGDKKFEKVIEALKSLNWYVQNPALKEGVALLGVGTPSFKQAFVFGRNVYQSACGSAAEPKALLNNLDSDLSTVSDELANLVYAGALFEAYFDKDGQLRNQPKSEAIDALFYCQEEPRYSTAVDWISEQLTKVRRKFLVLPSSTRTLLDLKLVARDGRLEGLSAKGIQLLEPVDDDRLAYQLPAKINLDRLRKIISMHFALPDNQFTLTPTFEGSLEVDELQLIAWGAETDVDFKTSS